MPETFLTLTTEQRRDALEAAAMTASRPAYLLEKDVWVVWALRALFDSPLSEDLVFKGGTSLSKAYGAIERFSEDVDLTYDIRKIAPEAENAGAPAALTKSAARRLSDLIRGKRLPRWVAEVAEPLLQARLDREGLNAKIRREDANLFIDYEAVASPPAYVRASIKLEFGARATGEPAETLPVTCYAASALPDLAFPEASPRVMKAERTFWEKATAIHVFCRQAKLRGDGAGFARHWHDLVRLEDKGLADVALSDRALAHAVADHKSKFFAEKDADGRVIDYHEAVAGGLQLAPEGQAYELLEKDYAQMLEAGLLADNAESFQDIVNRCRDLQNRANANAATAPPAEAVT